MKTSGQRRTTFSFSRWKRTGDEPVIAQIEVSLFYVGGVGRTGVRGRVTWSEEMIDDSLRKRLEGELHHAVVDAMLNVWSTEAERRLGHKKIEMTLNLYAHVLPSMQAEAASRLAALLHG